MVVQHAVDGEERARERLCEAPTDAGIASPYLLFRSGRTPVRAATSGMERLTGEAGTEGQCMVPTRRVT